MVLLTQLLGQHVGSWLFLKQKALGITGDTKFFNNSQSFFTTLETFLGKKHKYFIPVWMSLFG